MSTESGGQPEDSVDNPVDPVKSALAAARGVSRRAARAPRRRRPASSENKRVGWSGAHPDETDPQPVGDVLAGWTEDRGWQRPLAEGRLFADHERVWARHQTVTDPEHRTAATRLRRYHARLAADITPGEVEQRCLADYDSAFGLDEPPGSDAAGAADGAVA